MAPRKPPYDTELLPILATFPKGDITPSSIPALVEVQKQVGTLAGALAACNNAFTHEERTAQGPHGPVPLSIFRPKTSSGNGGATGKPRPCIYFTHSGGFICGTRYTLIHDPLAYAHAAGAVLISVEYRLAPQFPFPAAIDDAWAGLRWVGAHAAELGVDVARIMVAGQSAGANLTAGLALRARDEGLGGSAGERIRLCGMLIDCGMLDDRLESSCSINQYVDDGSWTRGSNVTAWDAYLGADRRKAVAVSPLAAPARAVDLGGLPPAFISVGTAEGFRDENVRFAMRIWEDGGVAELHAWPGGFHCFDLLVGGAAVSRGSLEARTAWVKRVLRDEGASSKL